MEFSVDPEVFARLHGMRLAVVVARGVDTVESFVVDAATPRIGW